MDKTKTISLECIFCHSTNFELPTEDYHPSEDENIKCADCGKLNIFADLKKIVKESGIELMTEEIKKELSKSLKKIKIKL